MNVIFQSKSFDLYYVIIIIVGIISIIEFFSILFFNSTIFGFFIPIGCFFLIFPFLKSPRIFFRISESISGVLVIQFSISAIIMFSGRYNPILYEGLFSFLLIILTLSILIENTDIKRKRLIKDFSQNFKEIKFPIISKTNFLLIGLISIFIIIPVFILIFPFEVDVWKHLKIIYAIKNQNLIFPNDFYDYSRHLDFYYENLLFHYFFAINQFIFPISDIQLAIFIPTFIVPIILLNLSNWVNKWENNYKFVMISISLFLSAPIVINQLFQFRPMLFGILFLTFFLNIVQNEHGNKNIQILSSLTLIVILMSYIITAIFSLLILALVSSSRTQRKKSIVFFLFMLFIFFLIYLIIPLPPWLMVIRVLIKNGNLRLISLLSIFCSLLLIFLVSCKLNLTSINTGEILFKLRNREINTFVKLFFLVQILMILGLVYIYFPTGFNFLPSSPSRRPLIEYLLSHLIEVIIISQISAIFCTLILARDFLTLRSQYLLLLGISILAIPVALTLTNSGGLDYQRILIYALIFGLPLTTFFFQILLEKFPSLRKNELTRLIPIIFIILLTSSFYSTFFSIDAQFHVSDHYEVEAFDWIKINIPENSFLIKPPTPYSSLRYAAFLSGGTTSQRSEFLLNYYNGEIDHNTSIIELIYPIIQKELENRVLSRTYTIKNISKSFLLTSEEFLDFYRYTPLERVKTDLDHVSIYSDPNFVLSAQFGPIKIYEVLLD